MTRRTKSAHAPVHHPLSELTERKPTTRASLRSLPEYPRANLLSVCNARSNFTPRGDSIHACGHSTMEPELFLQRKVVEIQRPRRCGKVALEVERSSCNPL